MQQALVTKTLYDKTMTIEEQIDELSDKPLEEWPVWMILFLLNDSYTRYSKLMAQKKLDNSVKKLNSRMLWEERIELVNKEVRTLRDALEEPSTAFLLDFLNKPLKTIYEEAAIIEGSREYFKGIDKSEAFSEPVLQKMADAFVNGTEIEITQEELLKFLESMKGLSPEIDKMLRYYQNPDFEKGNFMLLIDTKMDEVLLQRYIQIQQNVINSYYNSVKPKPAETPKNSSDFNEPRQILTIYLLLKTLGLEEQFTSKTQVARLIHLLAAKDIPVNAEGKQNLDNSTLYKKLKEGFKKTDKKYISDLEFIRQIIEPLATVGAKGINELLATINNEINNSKE